MVTSIEKASLVLKKVLNNQDLEQDELTEVFKLLLDHKLGNANSSTFGALFAAIQTKGPTVDEISALTNVVLEYDRISIPYHKSSELCGIVGTGKDDLKTFNVSTTAAIVAAAAGVKVVKNGSRSESSIAGTTDVLEMLGVNVTANPETVINTLEKTNITFCDAQQYFPKMGKEYVGKFIFPHPLSYTLSIASGLSFKKMIFGSTFDDTLFISKILKKLGMKQFMVVAGKDSNGKTIDEISNIGPTKITEYINGHLKTYTLNPTDIGIELATYEDIKQGKSVAENAKILKNILLNKGKKPQHDIVVLNAGALLYVDGKADTLIHGIEKAKTAITSGVALKTLDLLVKESNE